MTRKIICWLSHTCVRSTLLSESWASCSVCKDRIIIIVYFLLYCNR